MVKDIKKYAPQTGRAIKEDGSTVNWADGINSDGSANVKLTGSNPTETSVTIANGASLSGAINVGTLTLLGVVIPASWTAANLTFQGSTDGTNYFDLYDNAGIELTAIAAASRYIILTPANWVGIRYLKIRSGTGAVPVNQGADRILKLATKAV